MLNYPDELLQKVAQKIEEDFGYLDDISQELANAITNLYAIALSPDELESGRKDNVKSIAHMLSTTKTGELKKFVESLRNMSANGQPILKQYTEQFLIDTLKYGMDCRGLGGFPFIRSIKRQILKPIIPEDENLYQKIKLLRKFHEKDFVKDSEFINHPDNSDKSENIEEDPAICIKCGTFKGAALGRCPACNFAPETSLDAAKSVLLTIEHFSGNELHGMSESIKEAGIGKIVFPAKTIREFVDTVEDRKSGRAVRSILEMNRLRIERQGEAVAKNILGWRYMQGHGAQQDNRKAFELWSASARQGNAEAQYNLGKLYAQGKIVSQDYRKAIELFTSAGEQGHTIAQEALGILYLSGNGTEEDHDKGIAWLIKASQQGSNWAKNFLKEFYESDTQEEGGRNPDYGLHLVKNGLEKESEHYIYGLKIDHLNILDKNTLTTVANTISDGETYSVSFYIPAYLFNDLLQQLEESEQVGVQSWLETELDNDEGSFYNFETPQILSVVKTTLGDIQTSTTSSREKLIPLVIQSFGIKNGAAFEVGNRVFHGKFGYGKIINIDGHKLQINFDQVGIKMMMDNFVELVSE